MSEPERSNHWESVAQDIGVEPATPPPEPQPPASPPKTASHTRTKTGRTGTTKRTATDWASVAGDLGMERAPEAKERDSGIAETTGPGPDAPQADAPDVPSVEQKAPVAAPDETLSSRGSDSPTVMPVEVGEDDIDFGDSEDASTQTNTQQGQRRRRPRRRSSRKRVAETDAATPPVESSAERAKSQPDNGPADPPPAPETQAEKPTKKAAERARKKTPEETPEKLGRSSHRNIPPWEEAVGVLVDSNIENRASRSKTGRSGRSRSRGRKR